MSQSITQRRVVYEMPNEDAVVVRRDVEFHGADGDPLALDLYLPPDAGESRPPAVVLIAGFPDPGYLKMLGCRFKETQGSVSWGRLLAASGLAAVTYTNREPVGDLSALIETLSSRAAALGIAEGKMGVLGTSGHAPLALSLLMNGGPAQVACAAPSLRIHAGSGRRDRCRRVGGEVRVCERMCGPDGPRSPRRRPDVPGESGQGPVSRTSTRRWTG